MGTAYIPVDIYAMRVDLVNTPELYVAQGTNFPSDGYAFPQNTARAVYIKVGAEAYGSGNWILDLRWYSRAGNVTGDVTWTTALAAITPGDAQSIETKAFAASQAVTQTVTGTAKADTSSVVAISNLDSVAAGDDVWIKVTRTDTSLVNDAILFRASIAYSDGLSTSGYSTKMVTPADAASTGTALQDIPNTTLVIPAAGTYEFTYSLNSAHSTNTNTIQYAVLATGGTISGYRLRATVPSSDTSNTYGVGSVNGAASAAVTRSVAGGTYLPTSLSGTFTATAAGTIVARHQTNGGTLTNGLGSSGTLTKV